MSQTTKDRACCASNPPCGSLPEPVRMNYFHGQLISERDLRTEQAYFMEKLRHHHRCIHGYGVLCGLEVSPVPQSRDCSEVDDSEAREIARALRDVRRQLDELREQVASGKMGEEEAVKRREELEAREEQLRRQIEEAGGEPQSEGMAVPQHVVVSCGAAVDGNGRDLLLREEARLDLLDMLCGSERSRLRDSGSGTVYLSICYQECGREPTRPLAMDSCATTNACRDARIAEGVRFVASLERPAEDECCEPCCTVCGESCLLLAAIHVDLDEALHDDAIDHAVRRRFGLYDPTVITGISWQHGKTYSAAQANAILGTREEDGGIEIRFSRPVRIDTLQPGTIDLIRITGGRGLAGALIAMEGEFVGLSTDDEFTDRVRYRDATNETVQTGDRIMIVVRAPFLLDACCRPVEGLHVGGKVPLIESDDRNSAPRNEAREKRDRREEPKRAASSQGGEMTEVVVTGSRSVCTRPPWSPGPWTSSHPGNFESWFYVGEE